MNGLKKQKTSYKEFIDVIEQFMFRRRFQVNVTAFAVTLT